MRALLIILVLASFLIEAQGQRTSLKGITLGKKYKGDTIVKESVGGIQGTIYVEMLGNGKVESLTFFSDDVVPIEEVRAFRLAFEEQYYIHFIEDLKDDINDFNWQATKGFCETYFLSLWWGKEPSTYRLGFGIYDSCLREQYEEELNKDKRGDDF